MSVDELESRQDRGHQLNYHALDHHCGNQRFASSQRLPANGVARTTNSVAQEIMAVEAVKLIGEAEVPQEPSGPPRLMYTAVAFLRVSSSP